MKKLLAAALLSASFAACAAKIGNEDNKIPSHRGAVLTHKPICNGTVSETIVIGGRHLKEGGSYIFQKPGTRLIIDGALPRGVKLDVIGSPLQMSGDIGANAYIRVEAPKACGDQALVLYGKKGHKAWVEKKFLP